MISVHKESRQVTKSVVNEVIDAFDQFMVYEAECLDDNTADLFHTSEDDLRRNDPTDGHRSVAKPFEKFDASFRIDEIAQFQESIHFSAVGLDSSYCTSNGSSIGSNNMSFAQESLLSLAKSAHHQPALLDTSQSHDEENDVSFSSSSSFFMELKQESNTNKQRRDSNIDLYVIANSESKRSISRDSTKLVQQDPTISRTSACRKTRNRTKPGNKHESELAFTDDTKSSHSKQDESLVRSNAQQIQYQNMEFSLDNITSSSHRKKQDGPLGQSTSTVQQIHFQTNMEFSLDNITSSSHHSQTSLRRKPYESPRRRVASATTKRIAKETGNASSAELNASSQHSKTIPRSTFRSPRRRAMSRDLSKTDSMQSSTTDLSASSCSIHHYTQPLEKKSSDDIQAIDHNYNASISDESLDAVEGISGRRRAKMIQICSDGLLSSSSHHSQSSRRTGLSSPRHRGRGSSRSNLGICENAETSERTECQASASPAKDYRRARSRSRPRLRPMGGDYFLTTTTMPTNAKAHRRCRSQPRLSRELVTDAKMTSSNEHQTNSCSNNSDDALDARTAARIERARASREKHLAKLQREKEKTRNENRNLELLDGLANESFSTYQQ